MCRTSYMKSSGTRMWLVCPWITLAGFVIKGSFSSHLRDPRFRLSDFDQDWTETTATSRWLLGPWKLWRSVRLRRPWRMLRPKMLWRSMLTRTAWIPWALTSSNPVEAKLLLISDQNKRKRVWDLPTYVHSLRWTTNKVRHMQKVVYPGVSRIPWAANPKLNRTMASSVTVTKTDCHCRWTSNTEH